MRPPRDELKRELSQVVTPEADETDPDGLLRRRTFQHMCGEIDDDGRLRWLQALLLRASDVRLEDESGERGGSAERKTRVPGLQALRRG